MTTTDHDSHDIRAAALHEALHGGLFHQGTLDPRDVLAAAKRHRRRRTAITSAAAGLTACVAAGTFIAVSLHAPGQDVSAVSPPTSTPESPPTAVRALPQLPAGWSQLTSTTWFRIAGDKYRLGDDPRKKEWTGTEGEITAADVTRGRTMTDTGNTGKRASTALLLRDDVRRVVFTVSGSDGTFVHDAKLYRLAAKPGWVLAYSEYAAPGPVSKNGMVEFVVARMEVFDAAGIRLYHCDAAPTGMTKKQLSSYQGCKNG